MVSPVTDVLVSGEAEVFHSDGGLFGTLRNKHDSFITNSKKHGGGDNRKYLQINFLHVVGSTLIHREVCICGSFMREILKLFEGRNEKLEDCTKDPGNEHCGMAVKYHSVFGVGKTHLHTAIHVHKTNASFQCRPFS